LFTTLFLNNYKYLYYNLLNTLYTNLIKPVFTKLKFKGKGYYIYKNYRNTITPQFGYSHRLYLYSFYTHVKFLNKTTLVCFGLNLRNVKKTSSIIFSWRPVNIFTGRGVRFSKQIIYKKSGKISSYR
jgi:ribosomal protein L6P/L9E